MALTHCRQLLHRQRIAKHIGNMGADHKLHPGQLLFKGRKHGITFKQRGLGYMNFRPQSRQGPGDRVVLIPGDQNPAPPSGQAVNGNVQAVGRIHCENDLLG